VSRIPIDLTHNPLTRSEMDSFQRDVDSLGEIFKRELPGQEVKIPGGISKNFLHDLGLGQIPREAKVTDLLKKELAINQIETTKNLQQATTNSIFDKITKE